MREIKFRAWDNEMNKMYYPERINYGSLISECFGIKIFQPDIENEYKKLEMAINTNESNRFVFPQYTGLKDENGTEIYEGDILRFPEAGENVDVIYDDGAFRILFSFDDETTVLTEKLLEANYDVEVIGNIYENEDLI